jgi:hypothetical protein
MTLLSFYLLSILKVHKDIYHRVNCTPRVGEHKVISTSFLHLVGLYLIDLTEKELQNVTWHLPLAHSGADGVMLRCGTAELVGILLGTGCPWCVCVCVCLSQQMCL